MSKKILMNVAEGDECRIAVVEDGRLFEYFVDRPSQLKHLGNIYKGIVSNVEPGIQAAFIDLGLDRNGFLHVSDTLQAYARTQSVTELYHQVTRAAGAPEMPPYGEQVPPQEVKEEGGFTEEAESLSESTSQTEESGSDSGSTEDDNDSESDAASKEREEPEFLDNLTQVTPGHNVTHSPTEVLADRGDSGRMPAIRPAEQPQAAPIRHVEAPRPAEKPPEPDVVPGKVSEHEELGIVPQPKLPRKKRDPLALFQTPPAATDFKLPAPPKKSARECSMPSPHPRTRRPLNQESATRAQKRPTEVLTATAIPAATTEPVQLHGASCAARCPKFRTCSSAARKSWCRSPRPARAARARA